MLSVQLIDKRIIDYEQNVEGLLDERLAKIDILYWSKEHYTEIQIKNKIQRLKEELLGISNEQCSKYRCNMEKIKELEKVVSLDKV